MENLTERYGNFSSSEIYKLVSSDRKGTGFGAPALKYIKQKQYEIKLGRPITATTDSKPTNWGNFLERRAFDLLDMDYKLVSKKRIFHSTIKNYCGVPDVIKTDTVGDIKCPYNLEVFCDKIESLNKGYETYKDEFPEDCYQLISNSILTGAKYIEPIIYVPYKTELEEIREMANNHDGDQNKISFLNWANDSDLPYLIEGKYYKNLNIFRFEVPQSDIDYLTNRVELAVNLLNKN